MMKNILDSHYDIWNLTLRYVYLVSLCFLMEDVFADEIIVPASNNTDIIIERQPAKGQYLILWMAPEYGFQSTHRSMARKIAEQGIEVWQANIVESLFLPQSTGSIKQLDGTYIADVIEYAHQTTGKKILVSGDSYATSSALMGAHQWQQRKHADRYLIGAILFSPYTYASIPQLGLPPVYLPVVSATNIPVMIYQAKNSGTTGRLNQFIALLQQHDSPVYTKLMPDIMSLFYQKPPTQDMVKNAKLIPQHIKQMIPVLEKHPIPMNSIPLQTLDISQSGIDISLKKFQGKNTPFTINLPDVNGNTVVKSTFKGKVTLINFWATWCPPCIVEIPSLNRLQEKMKDFPFELISINYAENKNDIIQFMKKVKVEFPVLLDKDGTFANSLNIVTYPSSFILDKNGTIQYGVNAAIEWDSPEIIQKLKSLH